MKETCPGYECGRPAHKLTGWCCFNCWVSYLNVRPASHTLICSYRNRKAKS